MGSNNKGELTKEKMLIYEIIFNMFIKLLLVVSGLIAFFVVLYFLITTDKTESKMIYGGINLLLTGTIYVVYRHYFPKKRNGES